MLSAISLACQTLSCAHLVTVPFYGRSPSSKLLGSALRKNYRWSVTCLYLVLSLRSTNADCRLQFKDTDVIDAREEEA